MRKNDKSKMTIVEQLMLLKEETCNYACMFKEYAESEYEDTENGKEYLKEHCLRCPLNRLHYSDVYCGSNPEHLFGDNSPS